MNKVEMTAEILKAEVGSTAIFSCVEKTDLEMISNFVEIFSYAQDEIIIKEGMENRGLYVLLSGKLEILKTGKWEDVRIATLSKNAIIGETSLFKGANATATVKAAMPSTILLISKEQFMSYIQTYPKAGNVILTYIIFNLLQKLDSTNEELVQEKNIEFSSEYLESMMSMFHPRMDDILGDDKTEDKSWLND